LLPCHILLLANPGILSLGSGASLALTNYINLYMSLCSLHSHPSRTPLRKQCNRTHARIICNLAYRKGNSPETNEFQAGIICISYYRMLHSTGFLFPKPATKILSYMSLAANQKRMKNPFLFVNLPRNDSYCGLC
jgi:hypothetical protein